jgi:hypothetical protein
MSEQRKPESKQNANRSRLKGQGRLQKLLKARQSREVASLARKITGKQQRATVMKAVTILQNLPNKKLVTSKSRIGKKSSKRLKRN